ncbi:MAG: hypothetical protein GXP25_06510 [Planctomycetes bacterium]|nr:hypothetical protein [Planctomycetota bacterium]
MKWRLDLGQIEVVDDAVADALREKTPGQRMAMVGEARFTRDITGILKISGEEVDRDYIAH